MFMIVTYPWPVTSAHVELTGPQPADNAAASCRDIDDQHARELEEMVCWTDWERLAIHWYRLRLALRDRRLGGDGR